MTLAVAALAVAAASLFVAVSGGLLRACPATPPAGLPGWLVAGVASHAALMICGFLGTIVATERAVAAGRGYGWIAPVASAVGAALLIAGKVDAGGQALLCAAIAFLGVNLMIVHRQLAMHTIFLTVGAVAWVVGDAMYVAGAGAPLPWWFAFLVLTVAAERLEMTRLMRRARTTELQLTIVVAVLLAGATCASLQGRVASFGLALYGLGLLLLSVWLLAHDIASRTIRTEGLSRYMAACLLLGYGWLAIAGVGWLGLAAGRPWRDMALHALGLGFIVSMMMAHAPVIMPALTRIRLRFGMMFYLPVVLLHVSLAVRIGLGLDDLLERGIGASLNALALLVFIATMAASALTWRVGRAGVVDMEMD